MSFCRELIRVVIRLGLQELAWVGLSEHVEEWNPYRGYIIPCQLGQGALSNPLAKVNNCKTDLGCKLARIIYIRIQYLLTLHFKNQSRA